MYTQAPWWFAKTEHGYAVGSGDKELCETERREDARLMASAPELLALVKSAHKLMPLGTETRADFVSRTSELLARLEALT